VRPGEVVELLPLGEPCAKIDIVGVGEELIELLLICSMRPLDLAVQLRRRRFDVGVANAEVLNMPMELSLEFMTIVGSNLADSEREFFDDGIDEVDPV
jgi:hypothetical protein